MQHKDVSTRLREFEELCRQKGIPLTMQRRVILEAVLEREDHPTADQVYEAVRDRIPQLSRTTIYRVLDTLVELNIVRLVHHTGPKARFDGKIHRHHHLICSRCQKIIDLEDQALNDLPSPQGDLQGFEIDDYSIQFSGICRDCRDKT